MRDRAILALLLVVFAASAALAAFNPAKKLAKYQGKQERKNTGVTVEYRFDDPPGPFYFIPEGADPAFIRSVVHDETPKVLAYCETRKKPRKCAKRLQKAQAHFKWGECLNRQEEVPGTWCIWGKTSLGKRFHIAADRDKTHVRAIYRHELCHRLLKTGSEGAVNNCEADGR